MTKLITNYCTVVTGNIFLVALSQNTCRNDGQKSLYKIPIETIGQVLLLKLGSMESNHI